MTSSTIGERRPLLEQQTLAVQQSSGHSAWKLGAIVNGLVGATAVAWYFTSEKSPDTARICAAVALPTLGNAVLGVIGWRSTRIHHITLDQISGAEGLIDVRALTTLHGKTAEEVLSALDQLGEDLKVQISATKRQIFGTVDFTQLGDSILNTRNDNPAISEKLTTLNNYLQQLRICRKTYAKQEEFKGTLQHAIHLLQPLLPNFQPIGVAPEQLPDPEANNKLHLLQSMVNALSTRHSLSLNDGTALEQANRELSASIAEVARLRAQVEALTTELESADRDKGALLGEKTTLTTSNTELRSNLTSVTKLYDQAVGVVENCQARILILEKQVAEAKEVYHLLNDLTTALAEVTSQIIDPSSEPINAFGQLSYPTPVQQLFDAANSLIIQVNAKNHEGLPTPSSRATTPSSTPSTTPGTTPNASPAGKAPTSAARRLFARGKAYTPLSDDEA